MIPDNRPHGPTWQKNEPGTRTVCRCGRVFDTDDGFYIHMGKMNKVSEQVKQLVVKREKQ